MGKKREQEIEVKVTFTEGYRERYTRAMCEAWLKAKEREEKERADAANGNEGIAQRVSGHDAQERREAV